MSQHGPWFIKESNDVYIDPFVNVRVDQVIRPDGKDGQHVVVCMKPGVCVLAIDEIRSSHFSMGSFQSMVAALGPRYMPR